VERIPCLDNVSFQRSEVPDRKPARLALCNYPVSQLLLIKKLISLGRRKGGGWRGEGVRVHILVVNPFLKLLTKSMSSENC